MWKQRIHIANLIEPKNLSGIHALTKKRLHFLIVKAIKKCNLFFVLACKFNIDEIELNSHTASKLTFLNSILSVLGSNWHPTLYQHPELLLLGFW